MSAPFIAHPPPGWRARDGTEDEGGPPLGRAADLGPLSALAAEPGTTDLFVLGDGAVWVDRGAGVVRSGAVLAAAPARELAVRLIAQGGRHVDESTPCADVRLGDGIRVHVVLPPVSTSGTVISIRLPQRDALTFAALEEQGMLGGRADELRAAITARRNLLITGAGGSGKTTLLGALLALAPPTERIVVLEDVAELRIVHPHVVTLEARQANLEGAGGVSLDRLLREALRMRPDRLVVGECRGAELRELLTALNTGHDGGAGTLHANSVHDVPARLEALGALAGMSVDQVARQAVSALHLIVHLERTPGGRRIAAVGRLVLDVQGRLLVERT